MFAEVMVGEAKKTKEKNMFLDELSRILKLNVPADKKIELAQRETEKVMLGEEELEKQRIIALRTRFRGVAEEKPLSSQWLSPDNEVKLDVAQTNKLIWDRPGKGIFIRYCDLEVWNNTKIRFDNVSAPMFPIMPGYMKMSFNRIYLTNTAQAGKVFVFVVGHQESAEYRMLDIALYNLRDNICGVPTNKSLLDLWNQLTKVGKLSDDIAHFAVEMTNADTEYNQVLPDYTGHIMIRCRDGTAMRYAFVTGKVASPTEPYLTILANKDRRIDNLNLVSKTLYVASGSAGKIAEIEAGYLLP